MMVISLNKPEVISLGKSDLEVLTKAENQRPPPATWIQTCNSMELSVQSHLEYLICAQEHDMKFSSSIYERTGAAQ